MSLISNAFFAMMFGYLAWKVIANGAANSIFGKIDNIENPTGFRIYAGLLIAVCMINLFFFIKGR